MSAETMKQPNIDELSEKYDLPKSEVKRLWKLAGENETILKKKRKQTLDKLTALSQELGLYD